MEGLANREPPVKMAVVRVRSTIESLTKTIDAHRERLGIVMTPDRPTPTGPAPDLSITVKPGQEQRSGLASELESIADSIVQAERAIEKLTTRLEV